MAEPSGRNRRPGEYPIPLNPPVRKCKNPANGQKSIMQMCPITPGHILLPQPGGCGEAVAGLPPNNSGNENREMETPLSKTNPVLYVFAQLLDKALTENGETAQQFCRPPVDDLEYSPGDAETGPGGRHGRPLRQRP